MKNTFFSQQLVKLNLILSSALCCQPSTIFTEGPFTDSKAESNAFTWKSSKTESAQERLRDDTDSLRWLNNASSTQSTELSAQAGTPPLDYHTPGQLFFALESPQVNLKPLSKQPENDNHIPSQEKKVVSAQELLSDSHPIAQAQSKGPSEIVSAEEPKTLLINFNNISMIEYIR
ncbi:MAG: hypothetical protein ACXU9U_02090, partial [Parachlamydiaceae bacterium]